MDASSARIKIRCRAVIIHEGKLLVVKHAPSSDYYALPGGGLEYGEDPEACVARELVEELGVAPVIGRLLYVNTFTAGNGEQSIEFFFEITNGEAYASGMNENATHAGELSEVAWKSPADVFRLLPARLAADFSAGTLLSDQVRLIPLHPHGFSE